MILNKLARQAVTNILKSNTNLIAVVNPNNITNFPAIKIDAKQTPYVSVLTIQDDDSSSINNVLTDTFLKVSIEIFDRTADKVDDITVLVDNALINNANFALGVGFGGVQGLKYPTYSGSQTFYDADGASQRVVRNLMYTFNYQSLKGDEAEVNTLDELSIDLETEEKEGSQLDNSTLIQL